MRRSIRTSIIALLTMAAAAAFAGTASADGRGKHSNDYRRGAVTTYHTDHYRQSWKRHRHGARKTVVVVQPYRPVTRVIVRPQHRHHGHPVRHLVGQVLSGAVAQTLESGRSGHTVAWKNPDTQAYGSVTPIRTYQTTAGQYCREYNTVGTIGGREEALYGTACRMPDGSWMQVD